MLIPTDFTESRFWPAVLDERTQLRSDPAVYALLHERGIDRLQGRSRILYFGSTGELGGSSDRCRLRNYRYPNGLHAAEIKRRIQLILDSGAQVTFHWKHLSSRDEALNEETHLLHLYDEEHHELPPFNGRQ
jgi:hypothetical protein